MKYHLTLVIMAVINKSTNNKCQQGCGEKGTLVHCRYECILVQPLRKIVWNFLKKLKIRLLFDLAIPLLGIYVKNPETPIQKNLCTSMFIAALFTIAECCEEPECPSVKDWVIFFGTFTQWNTMQQKERNNSQGNADKRKYTYC